MLHKFNSGRVLFVFLLALLPVLSSNSAVVNFQRTVVVSPPGPTALANGLALIAGLNSITGGLPTPSATDRYLLKVEPGVYDLASTLIELPSWISMEGSGEAATIIRGTPMSLTICQRGLVLVRENATVRRMTIENNTVGIVDSAALQLAQGASADHMTIIATGDSEVNRALLVQPGCPEGTSLTPAKASNITATAAGRAVHIFAPGMIMNNVVASGPQAFFVSSGDVFVRDSQINLVSNPAFIGGEFGVLVALSNSDFVTTQIGGEFNCNFATCRCFATYDAELQALDENCALVIDEKKPKKPKKSKSK